MATHSSVLDWRIPGTGESGGLPPLGSYRVGHDWSDIAAAASAYLRLLIFLRAILIPACASSSPTFPMMYSAYKLNKQGDNIQPCRTPFPIWNQSVVPCPVLTVASWPVYRFRLITIFKCYIPFTAIIKYCLYSLCCILYLCTLFILCLIIGLY